MTKKPKTKVAATIQIRDVPGMTVKGRTEIVEWMLKIATFVAEYGHELTRGNYMARYCYMPKKQKKGRHAKT